MSPKAFWAKVDRSGDCWTWKGARMPSGYGRCYVDRRDWLAHRYAMHLEGHDVSDSLVLHRCDNPPCVRPEHLFLGSGTDNAQDMLNKGRSRSALTLDQIRSIQLGHERGTDAEVARRLGVTPGVIWKVRNGASFEDLKRRTIDEEFEGL